MKTVNQVWHLFNAREQFQAIILFGLAILSGLLELSSVVSILPFLSLIANPAVIEENPNLNLIYKTLGIQSTQQFLILLGLIVLFLLILTNAVLAFTAWQTERFIWTNHNRLSVSLIEGYFARPYVSFLNRNSADLGRKAIVEAYNLSRNVFSAISEIITSTVSIIFILGFLLIVDPIISLTVALLTGGCYALIYHAIRTKLARLGEDALVEDTARFKAMSEALGGIKQVKVLGRENQFIQRFATPSKNYSQKMVSYTLLREIPRFVLETLAFGSILLIVLYLMAVQNDIRVVLPIIGLYAFAGYRLLPSFKGLFRGFAQVRFHRATLDAIEKEVDENESALTKRKSAPITGRKLEFAHTVELEDVIFQYPGAKHATLRNIKLRISRNQAVAFVGHTGAGKTTLVDILLGLLNPDQGCLKVDGVRIDEMNIRSWQNMIGYVPQDIYLSDDTIERNIAFGIRDDAIDHKAVEKAARTANLHDFVTNELPLEYKTIVGERGVRLSGGQRQRIGIARALYRNPEVLIFDEATSSLDGITESAVLDAINTLTHHKTLITVAHRLATVRSADVIFLLQDGQIVAQGNYSQLAAANEKFRALTQSV